MRCRLPCWLYHIQCNPALWTGPQAATAYYTTPLTSRQPLKWRGGGAGGAGGGCIMCVCAFGVGDALV